MRYQLKIHSQCVAEIIGLFGAIAVVLLLGAPAAGQRFDRKQEPGELTKQLLLAAEALQRDKADDWKALQAMVSKGLAEHREKYRGWKKRSPPPSPTVDTLQLPIEYLTWQYFNEPEDRAMYVIAIAKSDDRRKTDLTLELALNDNLASWAAAEAMPLDQAGATISRLLKRPPPLNEDGILYTLIDRFPGQIVAGDREAAFNYIRSGWRGGPEMFGNEKYWRTLLKVDLTRARRELIPFFRTTGKHPNEHSHDVASLLVEFGGPSAEVAAVVRGWLKNQPSSFIEKTLHKLLFVSEPETELDAYADYIDTQLEKLTPGKRGPISDGVENGLIHVLLDTQPEKAIDHLRRFSIHEKVNDHTRFRIAEYLVRTKDETADELVRNWLTNQSYYAKGWMRESLPKWGDHGAELAKKHAALIAASREDRGKHN